MPYRVLMDVDAIWDSLPFATQQQIGEGLLPAHQHTAHRPSLDDAPGHAPSTALRVWIRGGIRFVTDGPFAETHEQLGGAMPMDGTDRGEGLGMVTQGAGARVGLAKSGRCGRARRPRAEGSLDPCRP